MHVAVTESYSCSNVETSRSLPVRVCDPESQQISILRRSRLSSYARALISPLVSVRNRGISRALPPSGNGRMRDVMPWMGVTMVTRVDLLVRGVVIPVSLSRSIVDRLYRRSVE